MNESSARIIGSYPLLAEALMFRGADQSAVLAAMPETGLELVGIIDFLPTIQLLSRLGGKRVFIQREPGPDSPVVAAIGMAKALILGERMGAQSIELPMLKSVERMLRDNAIRADFDGGTGPHELVDRYQLTQRHIRKILGTSMSVGPRSVGLPKPRDPFTRDLLEGLTDADAGTAEQSPAPSPVHTAHCAGATA